MKLKNLLFSLVLCLPLVGFTAAAEERFNVGIDFERIVPPLPGAAEGRVQVTEMFWYGCPHCYQFEPYLQAWLAQKPDWVEFVRIPAVFNNPQWEIHARAYYAAEVLGVLDRIHKPFFEAYHQQKQRLATRAAVRDFFVAHGVDGGEFDKAFDSFAVQSKVSRAKDLSQRYGIDGVPAMIVDGKYRVGAGQAASYKNLIGIADYIARKLHAGEPIE